MDINEAIQTRKSIRGYRPTTVPKEILQEILEIATRAPSGMNTQPWEITVVAGEVLDKIRQENIQRFDSGEVPHPEVFRKPYTGKYRERQIAIAVQLFQLMDIAREDREKRNDWTKRGFRFFDAPAAIIISVDDILDDTVQFDIGALAQTIALAALQYGLGTCIQRQGIMYPDIVREYTGISEHKRISICITIGYPDWDFPANKVFSEREQIEKTVAWHGI